MAAAYFGGAAYFGHRGYGTEFLGIFTFGSLHENSKLTDAAVELANNSSHAVKVKVVTPEELERLLVQGFATKIAAKAWRERASLRSSRGSLGTRLVRAICRRLENVWLVGSACRSEL